MVKLLENTFRAVNIGLVNEIALMCDRLGLNVWEIIGAAATKPFGYMPFYPGPGIGGHCIPLDPHYLSWKLKTLNFYARFIELAGEINEGMPYYVLAKIQRLLNQHGHCLNGSEVLVLGVTYKADVADWRETPAIKVMELLQREKAKLVYADPFTPSVEIEGRPYTAVEVTDERLRRCACVVILTAHSAFDYERIVKLAPVVFDTRNGTRNVKGKKDNVVLL